MLDKDILYPFCWPSIYTIFLSVISLIFLIATQPGTLEPAEAYRKAETGIRILAATACENNGSERCLEILKVRRTLLVTHYEYMETPFHSPS